MQSHSNLGKRAQPQHCRPLVWIKLSIVLESELGPFHIQGEEEEKKRLTLMHHHNLTICVLQKLAVHALCGILFLIGPQTTSHCRGCRRNNLRPPVAKVLRLLRSDCAVIQDGSDLAPLQQRSECHSKYDIPFDIADNLLVSIIDLSWEVRAHCRSGDERHPFAHSQFRGAGQLQPE